MKTSNKLFLTAIIIIIISMVTYDFALRAEYRKGTYKSPFYGMEKTTYDSFATIDNRVANLISVDIKNGKQFEIWIKKDWKEHIKISRIGTTLVIEAADKQVKHFSSYQTNIVIICPSIQFIITKPYSIAKSSEYNYDSDGTTILKGFNLQNLNLNIGKGSGVVLEKNKIDQLEALVGNNFSESARLTIASDNQINTLNVKVPGKNFLTIANPIIIKKGFTLSDSATVSMSGSFLNQTKK